MILGAWELAAVARRVGTPASPMRFGGHLTGIRSLVEAGKQRPRGTQSICPGVPRGRGYTDMTS